MFHMIVHTSAGDVSLRSHSFLGGDTVPRTTRNMILDFVISDPENDPDTIRQVWGPKLDQTHLLITAHNQHGQLVACAGSHAHITAPHPYIHNPRAVEYGLLYIAPSYRRQGLRTPLTLMRLSQTAPGKPIITVTAALNVLASEWFRRHPDWTLYMSYVAPSPNFPQPILKHVWVHNWRIQ